MSTTTNTAAAATTSACLPKWTIPTKDIACAATNLSGNVTEAFDSCCKGDSPVKYNDDCNIYCLAQGQTMDELKDCISDKSKQFNNVFCNTSKGNATATASATTTKETSTGTSTSSASGTSTSTGAAVIGQPISKTGLGLVAMLFCSTLAGVLA